MTKPTPSPVAVALRELRTRLECTQTHLATLLGVSLSTIAKWENDTVKPSGMAYLALAKIDPGKRDWWLQQMGGDFGQAEAAVRNYKRRFSYVHEGMLVVPIATAAIAAGPPASVGFSDEEYEGVVGIPLPRGGQTGSMIAARVRGISMLPRIADGALAIIDTRYVSPQDNVGHIVAARGGGGLTLKTLRHDGVAYYLVADNPEFEPRVQAVDESFELAGRLHIWITEAEQVSVKRRK